MSWFRDGLASNVTVAVVAALTFGAAIGHYTSRIGWFGPVLIFVQTSVAMVLANRQTRYLEGRRLCAAVARAELLTTHLEGALRALEFAAKRDLEQHEACLTEPVR